MEIDPHQRASSSTADRFGAAGTGFFYHDAATFERQREHLEQRLAGGAQRFRIWCPGAATGEQAYTVAMTARMALPPEIDLRVLATDDTMRTLNIARQGHYVPCQLNRLPPPWIDAFSRQEHDEHDCVYCRVSDTLRACIHFAYLDPLHPPFPLGDPFDLIVACRTWSFGSNTAAIDRWWTEVARVLHPQGQLYWPPHSEVEVPDDSWVAIQEGVYVLGASDYAPQGSSGKKKKKRGKKSASAAPVEQHPLMELDQQLHAMTEEKEKLEACLQAERQTVEDRETLVHTLHAKVQELEALVTAAKEQQAQEQTQAAHQQKASAAQEKLIAELKAQLTAAEQKVRQSGKQIEAMKKAAAVPPVQPEVRARPPAAPPVSAGQSTATPGLDGPVNRLDEAHIRLKIAISEKQRLEDELQRLRRQLKKPG